MREKSPPRQKVFQFSFIALTCAAFAAAGGIAWYLLAESGTPPVPAVPSPKTAPHTPRVMARAAGRDRPAAPLPAFEHPTPTPAPRAHQAPAIPELEHRYRAATAENRADIAREIAGANNADAVLALGRLFRAARHPEEKLTLLSALGDVGAESAPDARLAMLAAAAAPQHREVRLAALGSLADFDDARALGIIRGIAAGDADKSVREFARELLAALDEGK